MALSNQQLHKLLIYQLKNINDLEIDFEDKKVTALLGPNGNGKSTVLHALACCYQPESLNDSDNFKFSNFFLPHPAALWQGSKLKIIYSYRDGQREYTNLEKVFVKNSDRWSPRYNIRPKRNIYYLGIDKCVPLIEAEKRQVKMNYSTSIITDQLFSTILEKSSFILNKKYTKYMRHNSEKGTSFFGVEADGITYSALSMSAGEQKVFMLIEKIFKAPKYSLILIDEIDLLLHDLALKRLIQIIVERANKRHIQIIFTTHRESIIELSDSINIRHLHNIPTKTFCFNETKPDAINRLTGVQPRYLEIFVEDDLSASIIQTVANQLKLLKYITIVRYGAAVNCFTTLAGLLLAEKNCDKTIFILDGDIYKTQEEKEERIKQVITGDDKKATDLRNIALQKIIQYKLPDGHSPEKFLHDILISMHDINNEQNEIVEVADQIKVCDNAHNYIDDIILRIGWDKSVGLSKIIDLISCSPQWSNFIEDIENWLNSFKNDLRE